MKIINEKFTILSGGFDDTVDITQKIKTVVSNSKTSNGLAVISSPYPTISFLRIENTKGLVEDIKNLLASIVPIHKVYEHDNNWHDGNAFSHLKAMLMGNSIVLTISGGDIELNKECSVAAIDFNNKIGQVPIMITVISDENG